MQNILLLTDFSRNAQNAIEYALRLFRGSKSSFFLLNVHKVSNYTTGKLMSSSPTKSVYESIIKDPKTALQNLVKEYEEQYSDENYSFKHICDYDAFMSAVNQAVKLNEIDLIAMGTNGATGAKETIFGSNTISVIRNSNCPVLAIPENYSYIVPETILFATDHNEVFAEGSLKPLEFLIAKFNTELKVLTIKKDNVDDIAKNKRICSFFSGTKHSFFSIENVSTNVAIDCFVQLHQVDLTAKIINKESFLKRLFSASSTKHVTYKTRVPLLIMHP